MFLRLDGIRRIMVHGEWWEVVLGSPRLVSDVTLLFKKDEKDAQEKNLRLWDATLAVEIRGEKPVMRLVRLTELEAIELWTEEPPAAAG